ncbi:MAG: OB-fold protein [Eggerthella lenta]
MFAGRPNDIKEISIDGSSSFNEGDLFEKSVPVVIVYHAWKYDDPSLSYNSYTVADLLNELEGNAMRAKDAHKNELVQLKGYIAGFDASGSYVTVGTSDRWSFDDVRCDIETDEQKAILSDHSVGDYICLQGKITMVGELLGYSMDIHRIL